ncbi:MAG: flippase-like domain-containing protein [Candidatus Aenigmarchaeota archaeon]|nr:flippase-like domain-containing protein [Candidatus Aenigmarchaeota archaeon]
MGIKHLGKLLFSVSIIALLLWLANPEKVAESTASADIILLLLAAAITIPMLVMSFVRWHFFLKASDVEMKLTESSKIYMIGMFFSLVTPSKLGSLVRFYYLKRDHNVASGSAFSLSMIDKLFDIAVIVAVSSTGALMFTGITVAVIPAPLIVGIAVTLVLGYILLSRRAFVSVLSFILSRVGFAAKLFNVKKIESEKTADNIYKPIGALRRKPRYLILVTVLSFAYWFTYGIQLSLLAASFGFSIEPQISFLVVCMGTLAGMLPLTAGGIGTRDAMIVYLLAILGLQYETGVVISILIFVITHLVISVSGGLVYIFHGTKKKCL